ncbi:helix-turn-helix domain-containing protein [Oceanobacillus kimchii]|uniref:helix-turn-helix domain-containing protein n=1 Tax=Oceanobacillus kimchii TaxID=746691 RepID=UPI003C728D1C
MKKYSKHNSYGFRFKGDYQRNVAGLQAIGYELRSDPSYYWEGLNRGEKNVIVFQYTLNGRGAIRIGETTHQLEKGTAFFIDIPSDHCYYLPDNSAEWEFIFFTIYGNEAHSLFTEITRKHGHIFQLPIHAGPIRHILKTIEKIETTGINHGYEASSCAYSFIMECLEYVEYEQRNATVAPPPILKAVEYMKENFQKDITLDDIVRESGLSKYHFTRRFVKSMNDTPIHYLNNMRVKQALQLLLIEEKTIEEISKEVGYSSSNYFSKVFKHMIGETPSEYRKNTCVMPVNHLFID